MLLSEHDGCLCIGNAPDCTLIAREFEAAAKMVREHLSEIPRPGDYQCFDFIGEMLFAIRGHDGVVRAFHNVCRHRAARLLDGPRGNCTRRIICPYHAWSYDSSGRNVGITSREDGAYGNTPKTAVFLDRAKPSYIGGMLEMASARLYPF